MSNGNGTAGHHDKFRVPEPGAIPTTQPDLPTHAIVELGTIQKISRMLGRLVLDGQDAAEMIMALQQARPTRLNELKQDPDGTAAPGTS